MTEETGQKVERGAQQDNLFSKELVQAALLIGALLGLVFFASLSFALRC